MADEPTKPSETLTTPPVSASRNAAEALLKARALDTPPRPGLLATLDRFEILEVIGQGGMGVVLLARDPATEVLVAIKMLRPDLARELQIVKRFLTEARHMYKLDHASILRVLEVSDRAAGPYYVMPYKPRGSLAATIQPGQPLDEATTLTIARHVAEALAYAHAQGLIHRDVKPHNILLDPDGRAHLADFGLVRTVFNDSLIEPGHEGRLGTVAYMSPAVARGDAEDTRCDIYSFGAVLYEMLTGEPPYTGQTREAILNAILAGPPTPVRTRNPKAPAGLAAVCEGCMARELRDRYATMDDVVRDLDLIADGKKPSGPHGAKTTAQRRSIRRVSFIAATGLIAVGLLLGWRYSTRGPHPPTNPELKVTRAWLPAASPKDDPEISAARAAAFAAPAKFDVLVALYRTYEKAWRIPETAAIGRRLTELRPHSAEAWGLWCASLYRSERAAESLEAARRVNELDPENPMSWHLMANALRVSGQHIQSAEWFRRVLATWPDDEDSNRWLAHELNNQKEYSEAERYARKALALRPDNPHGWQQLAKALQGLGRTSEAADAYKKAGNADKEKKPANARGLSVAETHTGAQETLVLDLGGGVAMDFVFIPAGEFFMGSLPFERGREDDEGPQHQETVGQPLFVGKYEVTQAQWRAVMGASAGYWEGDTLPVQGITWDESVVFCAEVSHRTGRRVRLPTEVEWEYAARAGTSTRFSFGDNDSELSRYGWFKDNAGDRPHAVGTLLPNAWGLYDMHGNVWEFCEDYYHATYTGAPVDGSARLDKADTDFSEFRVCRGASAYDDAKWCRSAERGCHHPDWRDQWVGFRIVVETKENEARRD
ncbi:MAG: SUMF1/EgtB/PvdO family nonheme iron enzyme [Planctomycetota bacterium]